jgi:hypothetical protein
MAEIFVKRTGSDLNGNYWGMNIRRIRIQLDTEKVYAEARKEFRDSTDTLITAEAWKHYELPGSAYGSLLTASKITALTNWVEAQVNAPEPAPEV